MLLALSGCSEDTDPECDNLNTVESALYAVVGTCNSLRMFPMRR